MPTVPWTLLLNHMPTLMRAVDTLIDTTAKRSAARDTAPKIDSLQQRIAALEDEQRMTADVMKQVAENVNAIAQAAQASAAMMRRVQMMAGVALGLALVACALLIVLWVRG